MKLVKSYTTTQDFIDDYITEMEAEMDARTCRICPICGKKRLSIFHKDRLCNKIQDLMSDQDILKSELKQVIHVMQDIPGIAARTAEDKIKELIKQEW